LSVLLEPSYVFGGTLGTYAGGKAWGGAVIFERADLDPGFLDALGRTVSDDGLVSESLDLTILKRTRRVPIGGSIRTTLERHVRFMQIVRFHEPVGMAIMGGLSVLVAIGSLLFPLGAFVLLTVFYTALYRFFGIRRWTAWLAYPATLIGPLLLGYSLARQTFVWGGRRYRWRSKFDVSVVRERVREEEA
jgi:hypothetical protein